MKLPILAGPLRGRWWLPQSRGKLLRIFGGTYEPEQTQLFQELIPQRATVLDVGAHVGYYTLLAAHLAGPEGRIVSFEPNPDNERFLRRHVALNDLMQVSIVNAAVSDSSGSASFEFGSGSGTGHLAEGGGLTVRTVRLDDYCAEHAIEPGFIKIDVEGAELSVLRGGEQVIRNGHPTLFLSTHGADVHGACLDWLKERGYRVAPILGDDLQSTSELLCT